VLWLVVLLVGALALFLFAMAWRGATELIHPPHRRATISPTDYHLASERVAFTTHDGLTLRGWFIPAQNPRGTIIVCHGYTGECTPDLQYAPLFHQHNFNTLYFDFRGHGMSDGNYTSLVYYERFDVLAALDCLKARGITRAGLFGLSMGGAIALATAPLSPRIVGVVSDCTFAELWRVVAHHSIKRGVPGFLSKIIGWLVVAIASLRLRANLFSADPIHRIGEISPRPILLMHAEKDDDAPVTEAYRLFAAARDPKTLWVVPNATHRAIEELAPNEYRARLIEFFERVNETSLAT
jgi:fermentation-respiration switch protein FrsA (DUF1100 family)